ncbi:hypothetical protein DP091_16040 [Paenibacillus sp. MDMC362]|nr:hypothetical protein DP091_16040 [Paenibacillus sp. MDMC362]
MGIISAFTDQTFRSASHRQNMMVMTVRALKTAGKPLADGGDLTAFSDINKILGYAEQSIAALMSQGVESQDLLLHTEAAVILYRIWNLYKRLFIFILIQRVLQQPISSEDLLRLIRTQRQQLVEEHPLAIGSAIERNCRLCTRPSADSRRTAAQAATTSSSIQKRNAELLLDLLHEGIHPAGAKRKVRRSSGEKRPCGTRPVR